MRTAVFVTARPLHCAAFNRDCRMPPICERGGCFQGNSHSEKSAPPALEIAGRIAICARPLAWAQGAQPPVKIAMIEGLSGAFANTGEAVFRNLVWAVERVNAARRRASCPAARACCNWTRYDSKGQNEEALSALRSAIDDGAQFILQGNSSAVAAALIDAIEQAQRARARQARAVPQLLRGRPHPHQREVQLLALPLRRPCRHAHGGADGGAQGRQVA